ncbi:uncharacterized protein LOC130442196 isoform X1 [Diorhabda sublineata]|uniref:uncharacterized protein LOC130442196 isoform X1 n=1 Tax=Diorhabda sublineata TaxID=1163346 RepID=UPI0024E114D1|nr:uncharacterized protein LOC130442196 isoform X1 [Diorhabda sublineata]
MTRVFLMFSNRYQYLKKRILNLVHQQSFNAIQSLTVSDIKHQYKYLYKKFRVFNRLFGWHMVTIFSGTLIEVLSYLTYSISNTSHKKFGLLFIDTGICLILIVNFIILVTACHNVEANSQEFVSTCYFLQDEITNCYLRQKTTESIQ